jgi:valyl-tRNA synthetase
MNPTSATPAPTEAARIPDRARLEGLEDRWAAAWQQDGTHRFDRTAPRDHVYAIDTPPPTVSGDLHIGHCFSYTHTDLIARFQRMRGREVFYPMGFDDNGLNTERRVQLLLGVTCDPSLPYDPDLDLAAAGGGRGRPRPVSRRNFVELCETVTADLEEAYRRLWTRLGLSVDWEHHYTTIGERARRTSQHGFLRLLATGRAVRADAPTAWDVEFQTAVAQAEMEDREIDGAYHRLVFTGPTGDLLVDTTRPELLAACVALVAHPDDARYAELNGATARTPLFDVEVPIHLHPLADPEKGTGLVMVCTFGDSTDVEWWRDLDLPLRPLLGLDGRMREIDWTDPAWPSRSPEQAAAISADLAGRRVGGAREAIVGHLAAAGRLVGEPRSIRHTVRFWENGTKPLETVVTGQWFVRTTDLADRWRARGAELVWHPPHMKQRYDAWVEGLAGDWNISRQRYFGVPFPLWYPIGADGAVDTSQPIPAPPDQLPVDPSSDTPPGYTPDQRDRPGGFTAEPDVMDTWATSSLTPQIIGGWLDDPDLYERVFPFDLRPQAHEIIRTWLFTTIVRSEFEHGTLPWRHAAISGFVVDPDRKKLSKSKGNTGQEPEDLIVEFGADAVRYWAAGAKLGVDALFDRNRMKIGRRLALKLLNVARFVLLAVARGGAADAPSGHGGGAATDPLDQGWLAALADTVTEATTAFEAYDHAGALRTTETAFWRWCDDVVELTKSRAYGDAGPEAAASAHGALLTSLDVFTRLLAPFLPYATEEAWSWWHDGSVHRAPWPTPDELAAAGADPAAVGALDAATDMLAEARRTR